MIQVAPLPKNPGYYFFFTDMLLNNPHLVEKNKNLLKK